MKYRTIPFLFWLAIMQATFVFGQNNSYLVESDVSSFAVKNPERLLLQRDYFPEVVAKITDDEWSTDRHSSLQTLKREHHHWFRFDVRYEEELVSNR